MNLYFNNRKLTLDKVVQFSEMEKSHLPFHERYVIDYIQRWFAGQEDFTFQTSGSTGAPQSIVLTRSQMVYSAEQTLNYFFPGQAPNAFLLCIAPQFVGGTQQLVRALISQSDIHVLPPSAEALLQVNSFISLAAVFPLQLQALVEKGEDWPTIEHLIVGGGTVDPSTRLHALKKNWDAHIHEVYGMTETASHVAVKSLAADSYQVLGDLMIDQDYNECLRIKGTITRDNWLQTHDRVVCLDMKRFRWLGRNDWVINSGGYKLHPETLEEKLSFSIDQPFVLSSVPDARLTEKLVLVSQSPVDIEVLRRTVDLHPYEYPKENILIDKWPVTESGKLDRGALKVYLWK